MKWILTLIMGALLMTPIMNAQSDFGTSPDKFVVPQQKIIGADEPVAPGDIIILKISPIQGKVQHLKTIKYNWLVLKNGKQVDRMIEWPDKTALVFGAGTDTKADIKVILSIAYHYEITEDVKDKDGKVTSKVIKQSDIRLAKPILAQIKVGNGPTPPPDPDVPTPDPDVPDPVLPSGQYGLAKISYDGAKLVKLDSAMKIRSAMALAANYEGIAAAVKAGVIKSPKEVLEKTLEGNKAVFDSLKLVSSGWEPWDQHVQKVLIKLNKESKTMTTVDDFATAWKEISVGLKNVK
jgi:hypothetical protein